MLKTKFAVLFVFAMQLASVFSLSSCQEDETDHLDQKIEQTEGQAEELSVEFTVGDISSNAGGEIAIGPSSYRIHYAGKVTYDAGMAISFVKSFDPEQSVHLVLITRLHEASNYASYTEYSWEKIKVTIPEDPGTTVYYTMFVKPVDGDYIYGPVKTVVLAK